jgi:hypothetical protein
MVSRATARWIVVLGLVVSAAACTSALRTPGPDGRTGTDAKMITWSDGKEAIQITCGMPGGCGTRADAMCNGRYTTLSMDNMPTRGDASVVRGTGTVVVRCT